ncbi:MAG: HEAT repeat domain-containing protein [Candidatus Magnetomorum sp.]|nr:HEAT repeat domain-containing protein [Candidatus Magnetomorum sp.]
MNRFESETLKDYRLFLITSCGVCLSQLIATIQVYCSNLRLAEQINAVKANGYVAIPNLHVLSHLESIQTAFFSGLFFTGTIGLGIIAITCLLSWFWVHKTNKNKLILGCILLQWGLAFFQSNVNGWSPFSWYLILLAPLVFILCGVIPAGVDSAINKPLLFWIVPFVFTALFILGTGRSVSFISIRDYLLLPNSFGNTCNDFYYRYTLFPSEIIKPFSLKQLKTCHVIVRDPKNVTSQLLRHGRSMKKKCIDFDYLIVPDQTKADLVLIIEKQTAVFQMGGETILEANIQDFLKETKLYFLELSKRTDANEFYRLCIFISLVCGSPVFVYILFMRLLLWIVRLAKVQPVLSEWLVVGTVCIFIGSVILQIPPEKNTPMTSKIWQQSFQKAFSQNDWHKGVALLKYPHLKKFQKDTALASDWLKRTDHPVLKYWLIRFLSNRRTSEIRLMLDDLLKDSQVNVVCQSLYALGQQGDKNAIPGILEILNTSPHWYIQMYAYRALKRLGWRNDSKDW